MITDEMVEAFGMTFFSVNPITNTERRKEDIRSALESAFAAMQKPEPVCCGKPVHVGSPEGYTLECCGKLINPAPAVSVKPLEWRNEPIPPSGETLALSCVGLYCIPHSGDRFYLKFRDTKTIGDYSTLDKAKAAAQADYETRVLSALNTSSEPVNETPKSEHVGTIYKTVCQHCQRVTRIPQAVISEVAAPAVHEGWQLVPKEPTLDMLEAGFHPTVNGPFVDHAWKAMLAAAPEAPCHD